MQEMKGRLLKSRPFISVLLFSPGQR